jgi:hypothetical protein
MANIEEFDKEPEWDWEEELEDKEYDNLSVHNCSHCGVRLRKDEFEDYEDTCTDCIYNDTAGLIDDVDYEEEEQDD